jgi:O-antigen ligase
MTGTRLEEARRRTAPFGLPAPDAVTLLTVYLVVLYAIPSDRSIGPLGAAGSLSIVFGLGALVVWSYFTINRAFRHPIQVWNPVRFMQVTFVIAVLTSYVFAMTRAIPFSEVSTADTGLIRVAAWTGILFIAADGINRLSRLETLLRRLVLAGTAVATLGIAQFATGLAFVDLVTFPGLIQNDAYASITSRGGLVRSAGTANHPLEYGLLLSLIFPIALSFALRDTTRSFLRRWLPVALIALGMTLAGSRSAIIGLVIAVLLMFPVLRRRERFWLAAAAVGFAGVLYVLAPRVINNLRYLFVEAGDDPSSVSRTSTFGIVSEFFLRNPFFGRGFGTFVPEYQILDNQYLLVLVETGLFGALAFLGVCLAGFACSVIAGRAATRSFERNLGGALAASSAAGAVLMSFFDGLSFPQSAGTLFLVLGIVAAYWRLSYRGRVGAASTPPPLH